MAGTVRSSLTCRPAPSSTSAAWVPAGTVRDSSARNTPMAAVETSGSTSATSSPRSGHTDERPERRLDPVEVDVGEEAAAPGVGAVGPVAEQERAGAEQAGQGLEVGEAALVHALGLVAADALVVVPLGVVRPGCGRHGSISPGRVRGVSSGYERKVVTRDRPVGKTFVIQLFSGFAAGRPVPSSSGHRLQRPASVSGKRSAIGGERTALFQPALLSGSGVVRRITPPGRRRARRGGPCPGTGRCARTRRKRGRAAASPARRRGAVAARSAAATRPPPWC